MFVFGFESPFFFFPQKNFASWFIESWNEHQPLQRGTTGTIEHFLGEKKKSLAFAFQEIEFIFYVTGINNKQYFFVVVVFCEGFCYVICLNIPLCLSNVNNDYSCASELSLLAQAPEVQETPGIVDRALNLNASHCDRASPNILGRVLVMLRQGLVALMLGTGFASILS